MGLNRRILAILASLSLGSVIISVAPANAAQLSVATSQQHAIHQSPDALLRSLSVDEKVASNCAEFKGTLSYWYYPGKAPGFQFTVNGTLHARCGGTAHLRAYWTPPNSSEQSKLIGNTTGTENIEWNSSEYKAGISNMHVEVCYFGSSGGCGNSHSV